MLKFFGPLTKVQERADGKTLYVEAFVSNTDNGSDGEVVSVEALRAAVPAFLKCAVKEMGELHHAAGRLESMIVGANGKNFVSAIVSDPKVVSKIRHGVLRGLLVSADVPPGGRSSADPRVIERLELTQASLVDSPSAASSSTLFKIRCAEEPDDAVAQIKKIHRAGPGRR